MSVYGICLENYNFQNLILNEAYIGKTPLLLEAEKQLGIIRSNMKKYTDMSKQPEVLAFNRIMEKQFGMDVFSLVIDPLDQINAYTMVVAKTFDIAKYQVMSKLIAANQKDGYRFKDGNNLCIICNVYYGLMKSELTDSELMAVILHELGHNFADCISRNIELANREMMNGLFNAIIVYGIFKGILTLGLSVPFDYITYKKNTNKYKNKQAKKNRPNKIKGLFKGLSASCSDWFDYRDEIKYRLNILKYKDAIQKNIEKRKKTDEAEKFKKSLGRENEVIADKFAGIYGYGPEQATALLKMGKTVSKAQQYVENIPGIGKEANEVYADLYRQLYQFDVHPETLQRINEEIKTLQQELDKSSLDPKLIAAMKDQLNQLNEIKKKAMEVTKGMTKEEIKQAKFYAMIDKKDPDAVDEEMEKAITAAFDELLEGGN